MHRKTSQLQIRVSPREKLAIHQAARASGKDVSAWVLSRLLFEERDKFELLVQQCAAPEGRSVALAELNDFLTKLKASQWKNVVQEKPSTKLGSEVENQVAAMIEYAAQIKGLDAPAWTSSIEPLNKPYFASSLLSLRMHLLVNAPAVFKRRNLFVDTSIGGRV